MSDLSIRTTQNVNITFKSASVGDRILAQVLDWLIQIAYFIALIMFFNLKWVEHFMNSFDDWGQGAILTIFSLPAALYTLTLESLWEGQTLGKKIIKVKVIKLDGYQAGFGDYFIRWMFSLVDVFISSGFIGLLAMIINNKNQRLGDMAAGTAVISLKNKINIDHTILQEIEDDYVPTYPLVIKLSDNDARIIKENFEAALKTEDFSFIYKLREKIESVTGIKSHTDDNSEFIRTVLKDYNYYTRNM